MRELKLKSKTLKQWFVEDLKKSLKRRKLKVSGTKQELFTRLYESYKTPLKKVISSIPVKNKKLKPNLNDSLFKFYISMYYQVPKSKLASKELEKYGLKKSELKLYTNYNNFKSRYFSET